MTAHLEWLRSCTWAGVTYITGDKIRLDEVGMSFSEARSFIKDGFLKIVEDGER